MDEKEKNEKKYGRPPLYTDPQVMQEKIDTYFEQLGDKIPTVAGLCIALDFATRQSLLTYDAKPEFLDLLKKAKMRIELAWELRLAGSAPTGAIFWLKNHAGYQDVQTLAGDNNRPIVFSAQLANYGKNADNPNS